MPPYVDNFPFSLFRGSLLSILNDCIPTTRPPQMKVHLKSKSSRSHLYLLSPSSCLCLPPALGDHEFLFLSLLLALVRFGVSISPFSQRDFEQITQALLVCYSLPPSKRPDPSKAALGRRRGGVERLSVFVGAASPVASMAFVSSRPRLFPPVVKEGAKRSATRWTFFPVVDHLSFRPQS